ncbi:unnamed protein product [Acanthosepion pharaonis]|uniref:Transmembrane protein n=1 Tax=Acanthosepion pharaonis TaxID=158019 RepID=A0A812DXI7_ACAPH|nr:unnamed protein product [Sepia pharaonis]
MRRVAVKYVPRLLTIEQEKKKKNIASKSVKMSSSAPLMIHPSCRGSSPVTRVRFTDASLRRSHCRHFLFLPFIYLRFYFFITSFFFLFFFLRPFHIHSFYSFFLNLLSILVNQPFFLPSTFFLSFLTFHAPFPMPSDPNIIISSSNSFKVSRLQLFPQNRCRTFLPFDSLITFCLRLFLFFGKPFSSFLHPKLCFHLIFIFFFLLNTRHIFFLFFFFLLLSY